LHAPTRRLAGLFALSIAFVLAACSSGSQSGGAASGEVAGAADPTIAIAVPEDGTTVQVPFDVQLEASVPLGEPDTGNHHAHLYFDTDTNSADYDIVYGTTWQVTRPLTPGEHQVTVALANPDHSLAGPQQTITIQVGEGGAAGGGSSAAPSTEASPGY
jgi:hypothetical protein